MFGIIDEDKSKNLAITSGGLCLADVGQEYVDKRGYTWEKVSNGRAFRYKMKSGTRLNPTIVNQTVSDTTTAKQKLFDLVIPGGTLHEGDSITFSYSLSGNFTSYSHEMHVGSYPTTGTDIGGYFQRTNTTNATLSYTITARDSNVLIINTSTQYNYKISSSSGAWPCNLLSDITLSITTAFSGASTGRKHTLGTVNCVVTTVGATSVADQSQYRFADRQPFRNDSPLNVPLDTTAQYGTLSHPMSVLIRDIWAGLADKTGSGNRTNIRWIGRFGSHAPVYYVQPTDPIQEFKIGTSLRAFASYPFAKVSNSVMKMRAPLGPLSTGQSSDRVVILISEDRRFGIEFGQYSYNATTKQHTCSNFYVHDLYGYGISPRWHGFWTTTQIASQLAPASYGFQHGYRAAGVPLFAGQVRTEELNAGAIEHMIGMQLDGILMRSSKMAWVSTDVVNKTITIKPRYYLITQMDYSSLFVSGLKVLLGSQTLTCTGVATYNQTTNQTTFGVVEDITGTGSYVYLGGNATQQFEYKYQWPAAELDFGADNDDAYLGLIPLGQVFAIPPTVDLDSIGLQTTEGRTLARALQKYGGFINDTTGNTFMVAQCDQNVTSQQITNLMLDIDEIVTNLVPVLNYSRTLVQAAINNNSVVKPKPLLPLYT